jgi:hypothetical protein
LSAAGLALGFVSPRQLPKVDCGNARDFSAAFGVFVETVEPVFVKRQKHVFAASALAELRDHFVTRVFRNFVLLNLQQMVVPVPNEVILLPFKGCLVNVGLALPVFNVKLV